MEENGIIIEKSPVLKSPILIAGFEGWGNALDIANYMASYLVKTLKAENFAHINPDLYYRYDENRPVVNIKEGILKTITPPGGSLYAASTGPQWNDVVILRSVEPSLRWLDFADELFSLCEKLNIETFISLGSMYDNVLHTDRIISGIASDEQVSSMLTKKNVLRINYHGPSAVHSVLHFQGRKRGLKCISLWCHCPYYLQGTTHFGLLSYLGSLLSSIGNFRIETEELEKKWKELNQQIQEVIDSNPELQNMIDELRKAKVRGSWAKMEETLKKNGKVIPISDFMKPG